MAKLIELHHNKVFILARNLSALASLLLWIIFNFKLTSRIEDLLINFLFIFGSLICFCVAFYSFSEIKYQWDNRNFVKHDLIWKRDISHIFITIVMLPTGIFLLLMAILLLILSLSIFI